MTTFLSLTRRYVGQRTGAVIDTPILLNLDSVRSVEKDESSENPGGANIKTVDGATLSSTKVTESPEVVRWMISRVATIVASTGEVLTP